MEIINNDGKEYIKVSNDRLAEIDRWENGVPVLKSQSVEKTDPETGAKSVEIIISALQIGSKTQ